MKSIHRFWTLVTLPVGLWAAACEGMSRRRALATLAAGAAVTAGCAAPGGSSSGSGGSGGAGACTTEPATKGGAVPYCLVEAVIVRVAGARDMAVGEAMLANVDDNTAVIVARDDKGFHALSAICTHACCLLSLCKDAKCGSATTNPGDCAVTSAIQVAPSGEALLCPCHGSAFAIADGAVLSGPAKKPLPSYQLQLEGQDALVDTTTTVDASARLQG